MPFPNIDPVIFQIGPFALHWYGLAYIVGLYAGWKGIAVMARTPRLWGDTPHPPAPAIDALLLWVTLGVILGGRLGYVVFYNAPYYAAHPAEIFAVWQGGMSFHGGALGVLLALGIFARHHAISFLSLGDLCAVVLPIGLFLGRVANFINSELWGRVSDVPWAIIFPNGGALPRHPSQLYEAGLEGAVLFIVLTWMVWRMKALARPGLVGGIFLLGYGMARGLIEFVREPDAHIGLVIGGLTMGQLLSLPMLVIGAALVVFALRRQA